MVSHGVVALLIAALAQAAMASASCSCACSAPAVVAAPCGPAYEEGCCPGAVIEKKYVVPRTSTETYSYNVPTYARRCYQQSAGVDRQVQSGTFETSPVCETQETVVKVPTSDVIVNEQPLCRKTCTTSEYTIQIPIVETTCTSAPLCKKTIRQQENTLTTVSRKTSCAKQICSQNKITETPRSEVVCQNYQGSETKVGTKTVVKPEIIKKCVQLPPYKCMKPVASGYTGYSTPAYVAGVDSYSGNYASYPAYSTGAEYSTGYSSGYSTPAYSTGAEYSTVSAAPAVTYPSAGYSSYAAPAAYTTYPGSYSAGYSSYSAAPTAYPGSYSGDYSSYSAAPAYTTYPGSYSAGPTCTCA